MLKGYPQILKFISFVSVIISHILGSSQIPQGLRRDNLKRLNLYQWYMQDYQRDIHINLMRM